MPIRYSTFNETMQYNFHCIRYCWCSYGCLTPIQFSNYWINCGGTAKTREIEEVLKMKEHGAHILERKTN